MSISSTHLFTLSFIAISLFVTIPSTKSKSDLLSDLLTLQSQSQSNVIHLNDRTVSKFITSPKTPRPYYLLIFFDAVHLHEKPDLRLRDLSHEFALVASSFVTNNHNNSNTKTKTKANLFFCQVEFRESGSTFHLFGVDSLPRVSLVDPTAKSMKDDPEQMYHSGFNRMTKSLVEFIESRTKFTVGPIHRPPLVSRKQIGLIIGFLLIWFSFVAKNIFSGKTVLHDPRVWLSGTVFVYFFSVSGAMHTIIRKMPLFFMEKGGGDTTKLMFFYKGRELQFGFEGFAVGFLYTIVGLFLAFVTHVLVYVKDSKIKRVSMLFSVLISFWAVKQVIILNNWKTGYAIHGFLPSKWT